MVQDRVKSMSLRLLIESLRDLVETKLTPEITYQVTNYHPGDFRGAGSARGELGIAVSNGFPIKDDLKKLGFLFDPPSKFWVLKHVRAELPYGASSKYQAFLKRQPTEKAVMAAIPKVEALVKTANDQIVLSNQAQLSKAGIGGDDPKGTARDIAAWSDRQERSIEVMAKQGVIVAHDFDSGVGGFRKGGGVGQVLVSGNTFPIKSVLSRAGFKWNGKVWYTSSRSFSDDVLAKLVQAVSKNREADDSDAPQSVQAITPRDDYDPEWEAEDQEARYG